jgi:hypothetical protein
VALEELGRREDPIPHDGFGHRNYSRDGEKTEEEIARRLSS